MNTPHESRRNKGGILWGILLIAFGILILLKKTGFLVDFRISALWPYFLIILGIAMAVKQGFRKGFPYVLILIGVFHAIPSFTFELGGRTIYSQSLVFPLIVILIGIFVMLKPICGRKSHPALKPVSFTDPLLDMDIVFGGRKEVITSKDFKGGRINVVFGGIEMNMMQVEPASDTIVMDIRVVFGGCDLYVPSHWQLRNEIVPVFGGVEDNRMIRTDKHEQTTVVVLKGSCVFGGIEIKSF